MIDSIRKRILWFAVLVGLCYFPSLNGSFHFDDTHSIQSNLAIRSLSNIPSLWLDPKTSSFIPENRVYRPLVYTFYSICWWGGKGETWPFHFMKMTFHFLVVLAFYLIWKFFWSLPGWLPVKDLKIKIPGYSRRIPIDPASAATLIAILFAIHPACSECVDYIAATTSLQCALFYVWAFWAYLKFRESSQKKFLMYSLVLYFCSVASKEEGITLPAVILLTEIVLNSASFQRRILAALRQSWSYFGLGLILAFWIFWMHPSEGNESRGGATSVEYFMTQWRAYLWYMRIWFWPWDLNADNAAFEFSKTLSDPRVIQSFIGNLILIAFGVLVQKKYPAFLFGLLWFYITISPASSVVVLAEAVNEHRMYLSYIGFVGGSFTLFLAGLDAFLEKEARAPVLGWAYTLICLGAFVGTQERNRVWANDENLWTDTVEKNPTSGRALNNLALVYLNRGEFTAAIDRLKKCEVYWTSYLYCPLNLGISYFEYALIEKSQGNSTGAENDFKNAEAALNRAYSLNPHHVHTNFHLGRYYDEAKRDYALAVKFYLKSVELTGQRYALAEIRLARGYRRLNQIDAARASLDHALLLEPLNEEGLFEKGVLELQRRNFISAKEWFEKVLALNPNLEAARINLSFTLEELRKFDKKIEKRRHASF